MEPMFKDNFLIKEEEEGGGGGIKTITHIANFIK